MRARTNTPELNSKFTTQLNLLSAMRSLIDQGYRLHLRTLSMYPLRPSASQGFRQNHGQGY